LRKSTKFVFEFCGLDPIGRIALVDTATLSCFNHDFLRISAGAPCSFITTILSRKTFQQFALKKICKQLLTHLLDRNHHAKLFRWKSLRGWDSRPQLIVVSGLFGGNLFVGGILGHNLLLSLAFFRWESLRGWDF
jgi:hypothetical protein